MLLESIIVATCISEQNGCSALTSAYYQQSKDLKEISLKAENIGKNIMNDNKWMVYALTPAYSIVSHQPVKVMIYKGTVLTVDPYNSTVGIQWSY
jgi:hypothetical protein